jgi:hypothetical protein
VAVFVLERAAYVELRRLAPGDAFRAVLTHGYCFSLDDRASREAMVRDYLDLVERVPVYRLSFPGELASLAEMLDRIEGAVLAPTS